MSGEKVFIGPKLRELRQARSMTQAQFAVTMGVSASYINLIERNQRSASLKFLIGLSDNFGINWRQLTNVDSSLAIADLRQITQDPAFGEATPDIEELRSALDGSPKLVQGIFNLFSVYRSYGERLAAQNEALATADSSALVSEQVVHDFFRQNNNYFEDIEASADSVHMGLETDRDEFFTFLKRHLQNVSQIETKTVPVDTLGTVLRYFDPENKQIFLSEGLDYTNKVFQLAHSIALIEHHDVLNEAIAKAGITNDRSAARCRVELANYFAAAVMMPYQEFFREAIAAKYDIEFLATRFSVSYEQVCHRLTTMQKPGHRAIPFFFLRIDRGGNVSKRFNATQIQLARYGGACPRLDVHYCFRIPGRIMTQVVEMPDHSRYLTINRTVERPSVAYSNEDNRLAVSIGCPAEYAKDTVYGDRKSVV